jgi:hypothetical protein
VEGGTIMTKFMTRLVIAVALMPVGYALGIMLAFGIFVGLMSVEQVPTPIAAKPPVPTQIKPAPPQIVPPPVSQTPSPGVRGEIPPVLCWEKRSGCGCNILCERKV